MLSTAQNRTGHGYAAAWRALETTGLAKVLPEKGQFRAISAKTLIM
jgi:hypothetical protein